MLFQCGASSRRWSNIETALDVSKRDNTYYLGILYRAFIDPFRNHYTAII